MSQALKSSVDEAGVAVVSEALPNVAHQDWAILDLVVPDLLHQVGIVCFQEPRWHHFCQKKQVFLKLKKCVKKFDLHFENKRFTVVAFRTCL